MKNTTISYVQHSWSPWYGCTKVSAGCTHCFAERWAKRSGMVEWGPGKPRRLASEVKWREPLRWNKEAGLGQFVRTPQTEADLQSYPEPVSAHAETRVLVDLCDPWDADVADAWRHWFWELIGATPNLTWLLLTKRPENISRCWPCEWWVRPPANVWMGVSVENADAFYRVRILLNTPAAKRWVSFEPLLAPIPVDGLKGLDWAVIGGESGPGHREMPLAGFLQLVRQLQALGIPIWVKQDSGPRPGMQGRIASDLWAIKQLPLSTQKTP